MSSSSNSASMERKDVLATASALHRSGWLVVLNSFSFQLEGFATQVHRAKLVQSDAIARLRLHQHRDK